MENKNTANFNETMQVYINALASAKKSKETQTNYARVLNYFSEYLNEHNITTPQKLDVVKWRQDLYENGVSNNSIRQYLVILHAYFEWANRMGLCEQLVDNTEIPKNNNVDYDLLTMEEIQLLLDTTTPRIKGMSRFSAARCQCIVHLIILSGLRNAELRKLTLEDVDFERNVLIVRHGKGDKYRETPLPNKLKESLNNYLMKRPKNLDSKAPLFGSINKEDGIWEELTSTNLLLMIKRYVKNITGHDNIGTHDLRHAFASYASLNGADTRSISLAMGHSSEMITNKVYISILDKSKAATNLNAIFNSL